MQIAKGDAKEVVHTTLTTLKQFLAQESSPKLSEADSKANFIEPVLSALGWTGIGVVVREYYVKNSQEFIDYVMADGGAPILAIEAKAVSAELTEKAAAQLVQYCVVEGIEWAVLTNGREMRFFNTYLKGDLAAKLVLRLDLLAFNSDAEYDALFEQLWLLSRQNMTTPAGLSTWLEHRRMDQFLRTGLFTASSTPIKALRRYLQDNDIKASSEDVVQWFRTQLTPTVTPLPMITHPEPPRPPTKSPLMVAPPPSAQSAVTVDTLINAGLISPPLTLEKTFKGQSLTARIEPDGRVTFQGETYDSLSTAAGRARLKVSGPPPSRRKIWQTNGWTFWLFRDDDGQLKPIDALRQRYNADVGKPDLVEIDEKRA